MSSRSAADFRRPDAYTYAESPQKMPPSNAMASSLVGPADTSTDNEQLVNSRRFYLQYNGHPIADLRAIEAAARREKKAVVWFAGDSSLDNKYWLNERVAAVNGKGRLLDPPSSVPDVAHLLDSELERRGIAHAVVNTAVEATTLGGRVSNLCNFPCSSPCLSGMFEQDRLIRDSMRAEDTLVVSVGGNDIAMMPSFCTIVNIASLVCCTPTSWLRSDSWLSCAVGLHHFERMFKQNIETYLERLCERQTARRCCCSPHLLLLLRLQLLTFRLCFAAEQDPAVHDLLPRR